MRRRSFMPAHEAIESEGVPKAIVVFNLFRQESIRLAMFCGAKDVS